MSYTLDTKNELAGEKRREIKDCCKDALLHGMLLCSKEYGLDRISLSSECEKAVRYFASLVKSKYKFSPEITKESLAGHRMYCVKITDADVLSAIHGDFDLFTEPRRMNEQVVYCCDKCASYFLLGLFLARGHISEPEKESRLEIGIPTTALAEDIAGLLSMIMLPPCKSLHRGKPILLYKKSSNIQNFLAFIGADNAVLDLMSEKLVKELRNNTNRLSNVETIGINRSVSASVKQTDMLKKMAEKGVLGALPVELRQTAELRMKYEGATLAELALKHEPPISKSGVSHRLSKITEFAKRVKII